VRPSQCPSGGEQVDHSRQHHSCHFRTIRADPYRAPGLDGGFPVLTAVSFSLFDFILGLCADNFEKLQIVPLLIITPFNGPNRARVFSAMPLS